MVVYCVVTVFPVGVGFVAPAPRFQVAEEGPAKLMSVYVQFMLSTVIIVCPDRLKAMSLVTGAVVLK
jgi:hypothetical protein